MPGLLCLMITHLKGSFIVVPYLHVSLFSVWSVGCRHFSIALRSHYCHLWRVRPVAFTPLPYNCPWVINTVVFVCAWDVRPLEGGGCSFVVALSRWCVGLVCWWCYVMAPVKRHRVTFRKLGKYLELSSACSNWLVSWCSYVHIQSLLGQKSVM